MLCINRELTIFRMVSGLQNKSSTLAKKLVHQFLKFEENVQHKLKGTKTSKMTTKLVTVYFSLHMNTYEG